jgi:hypothetical protein
MVILTDPFQEKAQTFGVRGRRGSGRAGLGQASDHALVWIELEDEGGMVSSFDR